MSDVLDDARRFDLTTYQRALARMQHAPLDLDGDDFVQLGICSPRLRREAVDAQHKAQQSVARSATTMTKATVVSRVPSRRWTHKDGKVLGETLIDILKRALVDRDAQIAALRERVLLLEAAVVTRDEVRR